MTKIDFRIPGKPQGKARARTFYNPKLGRSQSITPEKTVLYENLIKMSYAGKYDGIQWEADTPLVMWITAYFNIPKSTSKKDVERIRQGRLFPAKKPDVDNIAKVICDALNGVAYADDKQIVALHVGKAYTEGDPFVDVFIHEQGGEDGEEERN